jgi:hypothetical protein
MTSATTADANQLWQQAHAQFANGHTAHALHLFEQLANAGYANAQCDLGRLHVFDLIPDASPSRGLACLESAAQAGHPQALYLLAVLSLGERVLPLDADRLADWVRLSAQAGYPPALRTLALHWARFGSTELHALGTLCLENAAKGGDPVSLALLADRLARGDGCDQNQVRADAIAGLLVGTGLPVTTAKQPLSPVLARPAQLDPLPILPRPDFVPALAAPSLKTLRADPFVASTAQVLGREECRFVILLGAPMLQPSVTVDPDGNVAPMQLRTSHDMVFDPMLEDVTLRLIERRMAGAVGLPLSHGEPLILLRYAPGQEYRPHRDYLPPSKVVAVDHGGSGQREATVIAYLNEVEAGGLTQFPLLDLEVSPIPGSLLAFRNLDQDGQPEPRSLHAGLPVTAGMKWICTLWLREAPIRTN